jgi:hypothetical protein
MVSGGPISSKTTVVPTISVTIVSRQSGNVSPATSAMPTATPACGRSAGPIHAIPPGAGARGGSRSSRRSSRDRMRSTT